MLENDRVRVFEYHSRPGEKSEMHSHPASLVYSFNPATLLIMTPYGVSEEFELKTGELIWREETAHAVQNIGQTEAHLLIIELKGLPGR
jgi:quercetin dioxygenase-like cupin family protein